MEATAIPRKYIWGADGSRFEQGTAHFAMTGQRAKPLLHFSLAECQCHGHLGVCLGIAQHNTAEALVDVCWFVLCSSLQSVAAVEASGAILLRARASSFASLCHRRATLNEKTLAGDTKVTDKRGTRVQVAGCADVGSVSVGRLCAAL